MGKTAKNMNPEKENQQYTSAAHIWNQQHTSAAHIWNQQHTSAAHITNPCIGCDLKEWCGEDDCAKKGYPIDLPTTRFKNLNDMITYFRTHDILGL